MGIAEARMTVRRDIRHVVILPSLDHLWKCYPPKIELEDSANPSPRAVTPQAGFDTADPFCSFDIKGLNFALTREKQAHIHPPGGPQGKMSGVRWRLLKCGPGVNLHGLVSYLVRTYTKK